MAVDDLANDPAHANRDAARWYEAERRLAAGDDRRVVFAFGGHDAVIRQGQRRVPEDRSAVYLAAMLARGPGRGHG